MSEDWNANVADGGGAPFNRNAARRAAYLASLRAHAVRSGRSIARAIASLGARMPRFTPDRTLRGRLVTGTLMGISAIAFCALVVFGAAVAWTVATVPVTTADSTPVSLAFEASDGEPLARRGTYVEHASYEQFPDVLKAAVMAIEDRRFEYHHGVDLRGIGRAMVRNVTNGGYLEGASTITQQLVKMQWDDDSRTLGRKVREAMMAIWLETRLGKREIMTRYLNRVYMGKGNYGVAAASQYYFGKPVDRLTLQEAAMLAGMIKAPSRLNPGADPEAARERMTLVLDAMAETGAISADEARQAAAEPPRIVETRHAELGPWFTDWVASQASALVGNFKGPVRVRTTLDPRLQKLAEEVVTASLDETGSSASVTQAALVAMRPDGSVLAMVGGRDYDESQFNRAVSAKRQPGSTFKLFVYLAALRSGYRLSDEIEDSPLEVRGWSPENYDGNYRGWTTLENAFAHSLNAATVRLALDVGMENVVKAAHDLGIDRPLAPNPSLALGATEVSLLELTTAYAAVQGNRPHLRPRGIASLDAPGDGPTLAVEPTRSGSGLGPEREGLIRLLRQVVTSGTGRRASLDGFSAGKTGTSQDYRDAWFIGFDETMTVGVWVGNDDNTPMKRVTGGGLPARIWKTFMTRAADEAPQTIADAVPNSGLQTVNVMTADGDMTSYAVPYDQQEAGSGMCDVSACEANYRSFRASDCTYQPYEGPRQFCDAGEGSGESYRTFAEDESYGRDARHRVADEAYGRDDQYRAPDADRWRLPTIWVPAADDRPARSTGIHQDMRRAWHLDR